MESELSNEGRLQVKKEIETEREQLFEARRQIETMAFMSPKPLSSKSLGSWFDDLKKNVSIPDLNFWDSNERESLENRPSEYKKINHIKAIYYINSGFENWNLFPAWIPGNQDANNQLIMTALKNSIGTLDYKVDRAEKRTFLSNESNRNRFNQIERNARNDANMHIKEQKAIRSEITSSVNRMSERIHETTNSINSRTNEALRTANNAQVNIDKLFDISNKDNNRISKIETNTDYLFGENAVRRAVTNSLDKRVEKLESAKPTTTNLKPLQNRMSVVEAKINNLKTFDDTRLNTKIDSLADKLGGLDVKLDTLESLEKEHLQMFSKMEDISRDMSDGVVAKTVKAIDNSVVKSVAALDRKVDLKLKSDSEIMNSLKSFLDSSVLLNINKNISIIRENLDEKNSTETKFFSVRLINAIDDVTNSVYKLVDKIELFQRSLENSLNKYFAYDFNSHLKNHISNMIDELELNRKTLEKMFYDYLSSEKKDGQSELLKILITYQNFFGYNWLSSLFEPIKFLEKIYNKLDNVAKDIVISEINIPEIKIPEFKFPKNEKGTNFWDFLISLFDGLLDVISNGFSDILNLFDSLTDKIISLLIPKDIDFLDEGFKSIEIKFNSKFESFINIGDGLKKMFTPSNADFIDAISFEFYGNKFSPPKSLLDRYVPIFRNLMSVSIWLTVAVGIYKKVTGEGDLINDN